MTYQRHPLDIGPLVFGVTFLGIVASWGLFELDVVSGAGTAWILPIVLTGAGALGVVLAATRGRRDDRLDRAYDAAPTVYPWPAGAPDTRGRTPDTSTPDTSTTDPFTTDTLDPQERRHD